MNGGYRFHCRGSVPVEIQFRTCKNIEELSNAACVHFPIVGSMCGMVWSETLIKRETLCGALCDCKCNVHVVE